MDQEVGAQSPQDGGRAEGVRRRSKRIKLPSFAGPLAALIVLCIFLGVLSPTFVTLSNLFNIGQQVAVLAVLAIGGTAVIILGGIDLSVGGVLALSGGLVGVAFVNHGVNIWLAAIIGIIAGAIIGAMNGVLIIWGKLPPFIATLAMMSITRGLTLVILNGQPLSGYPQSFQNLTTFYVAGWVPTSVIIAVVLMVLGGMYFRWLPSGRGLYALGANYEVARLSGLPVQRLTIMVYSVAGLLAGVGGVMMTSRLVSAQPTAGTGIELDVIAAVVIGGASLAGGYGSVLGTAVGVLIIGVLRNGLNLLNVSSFWQQVVIGTVIAAAVLVENVRQRKESHN